MNADVLAAAGGLVTVARDNRDLCGLIVVIDHHPYGLPNCLLPLLRDRREGRGQRQARPTDRGGRHIGPARVAWL